MGNIISFQPNIKVTTVVRATREEEINLRNSEICVGSVNAVRNGDESQKIYNYYRLPNAKLPEGKDGAHRCKAELEPNNRVLLDYDVHDGGLAFYNEKIRGHEEELNILHAELSAHNALHMDVPVVGGLSRLDTIRWYSQKLGVEFDTACQDLARACFLVPQADVLYDTDEYYEGFSEPQTQDITDFEQTPETTTSTVEIDEDLEALLEQVRLYEENLADVDPVDPLAESLDDDFNIESVSLTDDPNAYHRKYEEDEDEFQRIIKDYIIENQADITSYEPDWFRVGCACYAVLGEDDGRYAFHSISKFYPNYSPSETEKKYNNIAAHMYSECGIGTLIYLCRQAGLFS